MNKKKRTDWIWALVLLVLGVLFIFWALPHLHIGDLLGPAP